MTEPLSPESDRKQLSQAIGSLIWKDPARILDAVSRMRDAGTVIECGLRGGSMEPAIPRGSRLRVDLGRSPYRVGEVVAFVRDSDICVHRIAHISQNRRAKNLMVTQGDACFYPDAPVEIDQVIGRVIEHRQAGPWSVVGGLPDGTRARSLLGRALLRVVACLMRFDVRLARGATKVLRLRKEDATAAES